jgi:hypothetical protein
VKKITNTLFPSSILKRNIALPRLGSGYNGFAFTAELWEDILAVGGHQEEVDAGMGNEAGAAHTEVVAVQTMEVVQRVVGAGSRAVAEA